MKKNAVWSLLGLCIVTTACLLFLNAPAAATANLIAKPSISNDKPYLFAGQDKNYLEPTFDHLSRLYWSIGMFDVADDEAIDNFMLINECQLYLKYFHDDIEWHNIRNAVRDKLGREVSSYPKQFEIIMPVVIGEYDIEKQEFAIGDGSALNDVTRFDVFYNKPTKICDLVGSIPSYPFNMVLLFDQPLNISRIPLSTDQAREYLKMTKEQFSNYTLRGQFLRYKRLAYVSLKFTVFRYKSTINTDRGIRAAVFARVNRYDIYGSETDLTPLYSKDFDAERAARKAASINMMSGNGPIIETKQGEAPDISGAPSQKPEEKRPATINDLNSLKQDYSE